MKTKNKEQGVVMVLTIVLIVVIIGLFGIIYLRGASSLVHVEVQAAVDEAAQAGARALSSTRASWDNARAEVLRVLGNHDALGGGVDGSDLTTTAGFDANGDAVDTGKNLEVKVHRGWWRPGDNPRTATETEDGYFTSMEGNWDTESPGLIKTAIANAVEVEVKRTEFRTPFASALFGDDGAEIKARAIAVGGPVDGVQVAPFAIPLCALLGNDGDFHPYLDGAGGGGAQDMVCRGDRFFTRADRYCNGVDDDSCDVKPAVLYNTCSSRRGADDGLCVSQDDGNYLNYAITNNTARTDKTGWYNANFNNVPDHFGVVGVPCTGGAPSAGAPGSDCTSVDATDTLISSIINGDGIAPVEAVIGQRFAVSKDGIKDTALGNAIWNNLINRDDAVYNRGVDETDIGALNPYDPKQNYTFSLNLPVAGVGTDDPLEDGIDGNEGLINYRSSGFINSMRADFTGIPVAERYRPDPDPSKAHCSNAATSKFVGCQAAGFPGFPLPSEYLPIAGVPTSAVFDTAYLRAADQTDATDQLLNELNTAGEIVTLGVRPTVAPADQKVWHVKVPVIAADVAPGMTDFSCQGVNGSTEDPAIFPWSGSPLDQDLDIPYVIVGFVTVDIYDLNMLNNGDPLLPQFAKRWFLEDESLADISNAANLASARSTYLGISGHSPTDPSCPPDPATFTDFTGPTNWNFQDSTGATIPATEIGIVQAKVNCDSSFIPSSVNGGETDNGEMGGAPVPRQVRLVK